MKVSLVGTNMFLILQWNNKTMSYPKWNFRRQCVAMVDDGWPVISIPAVEFHTAATRQKHLAVHVDGGLAVKLVARQVCVVRRLDVVMRHRMVHILGKIQKICIP